MFINSIPQNIGNTTLMELRIIVPEDHARNFIQLEGETPTGSIQDRMALAKVEVAEQNGLTELGL